MIEQIISFLEEHRMLQQGDCVTVGLSGGADSVALLYVLRELAPRYALNLSACHVNHQLRGEEGDCDESFCQKLCQALAIPFVSRKIDVSGYCKANKLSIEEGARKLRYQALLEVASGKIATAHHADDNAERVLINLLRGTALDGLCGIAPVRGRIIRPLLGTCRAELLEYLSTLGQDYRTDHTNLEDAQLRNRLRHHVLPLLQKENPSFSMGIHRMTNALRKDRDLLETDARALLDRAALPSPPVAATVRLTGLPPSFEAGGWSRAELLLQPLPLRLRALRFLCTDYKIDYDQNRLLLLDQCLANTGCIQLKPDVRLVVTESRVSLERKISLAPIRPTLIPYDEPKTQRFPITGGRVLVLRPVAGQEIKLFVNKCNFQFENVLDCDRISGIIRLRSRQEGDSIRLLGREHTQTLKKLMNAAAIPPPLRPGLALLEDGQGLLWVEGFGVCGRAAATQETQRAIFIEIQEERQNDAG